MGNANLFSRLGDTTWPGNRPSGNFPAMASAIGKLAASYAAQVDVDVNVNSGKWALT